MRVLICGGRDFRDEALMTKILSALHAAKPFSVAITGMARGADLMAWYWAKKVGFVPTDEYPADWSKYGNSAGPIRNKQMLDDGRPDLVVAFPGGKGTANMIEQSKRAGVKVLQVSADGTVLDL
jgi:hypothetical protein